MGQANHRTVVISQSSLLNKSLIPSSLSFTGSVSPPPSSLRPSRTPGPPGTWYGPTTSPAPGFSPDDFSPFCSSSSNWELSFFPFFFAALSIRATYSLCLERQELKCFRKTWFYLFLARSHRGDSGMRNQRNTCGQKFNTNFSNEIMSPRNPNQTNLDPQNS